MSPRAIRRAAERQASKLASKVNAATAGSETVHQQFDTTEPLSEARLIANRENAQKSTGPITPAGKAKSSLNAVKTGLTGRTVLLSTDDAAIYQQHLDRFVKQHAPATDEEKSLVQSIGDSEWRLLRIVPLEAGIYAIGRRELAAEFADEQDLVAREALIQAEIFMSYRKDLSNLALQERRLRNQRDADVAKLEKLQNERREKYARDISSASYNYQRALKRNVPFDSAFFGFDFSIEQLEDYHLHEQAKDFILHNGSELPRQKFDDFFAKWKARQAAA